jgi:hypothetical protein
MKKRFLSWCLFCVAALNGRATEANPELGAAIQELSLKSYRWDTDGWRPSSYDAHIFGKKDSSGLTEWQVESGRKIWTCYVLRGRGAFGIDGAWYPPENALMVAQAGVSPPRKITADPYYRDPALNQGPSMIGTLVITVSATSEAIQQLIDLAQRRTPGAELDWYLSHASKIEAKTETKNHVFTLTLDEAGAQAAGGLPMMNAFGAVRLDRIVGTVHVWLENGVITKYDLLVRWRENGTARKRTSITRIKEVGAVKIDLPEQASLVLQ